MGEKKQSTKVLKNKIKYLEEELMRKQDTINKLKKENLILFKTAVKRSEEKVNEIDNENKNYSAHR